MVDHRAMKLPLLALCALLTGCATLASKDTVAACQAADVVTTKMGLSHGAIEANPISRNLLAYGWLPLIVTKATLTLILRRDDVPDEARIAANVITCGAVANNLKVIAK
jgi:Domain of unknown function (DUF5658)